MGEAGQWLICAHSTRDFWLRTKHTVSISGSKICCALFCHLWVISLGEPACAAQESTN